MLLDGDIFLISILYYFSIKDINTFIYFNLTNIIRKYCKWWSATDSTSDSKSSSRLAGEQREARIQRERKRENIMRQEKERTLCLLSEAVRSWPKVRAHVRAFSLNVYLHHRFSGGPYSHSSLASIYHWTVIHKHTL